MRGPSKRRVEFTNTPWTPRDTDLRVSWYHSQYVKEVGEEGVLGKSRSLIGIVNSWGAYQVSKDGEVEVTDVT